jgi:hypothetical protein
MENKEGVEKTGCIFCDAMMAEKCRVDYRGPRERTGGRGRRVQGPRGDRGSRGRGRGRGGPAGEGEGSFGAAPGGRGLRRGGRGRGRGGRSDF